MKEFLPLIDLLIILLTLFAGPYRVAAYKFRSFGGIGQGLVTWIGIGLVFPAFVWASKPEESWWLAWAALAIWGYAQMMAKWCSTAPPLDPALPHCWLGKAELFFAFPLIWVAGVLSGSGGAAFFLAGYACSTAQWLLHRLRRRLEAWTPRDTERLMAPACTTAAGVAKASPICGRFALRYGLLLASAIGRALRFLWRRFVARPTPQPAPGQGYYAPPRPGVVRGFTRYLISHMIFSIITGVIGFNIIGIPFAIMLWFMGWKVGLPVHVKEQARSYIARAKEAISDEKDEVMEKLRVRREAMEETLRQQKQRFAERFSRGRPRPQPDDFAR
jgi:hypothetical protein